MGPKVFGWYARSSKIRRSSSSSEEEGDPVVEPGAPSDAPMTSKTRARGTLRRRRWPISVVHWLNTKSLEPLEAVLHGFERFRGVPLPIRDLTRDP